MTAPAESALAKDAAIHRSICNIFHGTGEFQYKENSYLEIYNNVIKSIIFASNAYYSIPAEKQKKVFKLKAHINFQ